MSFNNTLLTWYKTHKRPLPWRINRNPYRTWVSEIILQQTRVLQGTEYFHRFVAQFPDVKTLAAAEEVEVLKLWEGLGYYSRARNLHTAAKQVVNDYGAQFPATYKELQKLKGVGTYTAAAIASINYGEKVAVVDGNVFRVLARIFGMMDDISKASTKHIFQQKAETLIGDNPGEFNEALMEFGALQCTPKKPNCGTCPFADTCVALEKDITADLPIKLGKTKVADTHYHFLVFIDNQTTWVKKLTELSIWQGLYNFPLLSSEKKISKKQANQLASEMFHTNISVTKEVTLTHLLSHKKITATFWTTYQNPNTTSALEPYAISQPNPIPLSRLASRFLEHLINLQPKV